MSVRVRTGIAILIVILASLVYLGVSLARRGYSARDKPSRIEEFLARNARRIATPREARQLRNPYTPTTATVESVREHWAEHCALCHGIDGSGNTPIGQSLYPKPTDLKSPTVQGLSDGEIFYIISNGVRFTGMPSWSGTDSAEEIWQLVSFIRKLPTLSPTDLELLKRSPNEQSGSAQKMEGSAHTH
ncbi:MAG: cytochrome c [Acidobacteria bacterium]|nr:cytochrome c [Acidobacteriota bacterium]